MLVLTIRTDNPKAEIGLYQDSKKITYESWEAHRELSVTIHKKIMAMLASQKYTLESLDGIVSFKGPGSFTGLRIGLSVANALAFGLSIPIVSTQAENWIRSGVERLKNGDNEITALPEYGADAHITKQRK